MIPGVLAAGPLPTASALAMERPAAPASARLAAAAEGLELHLGLPAGANPRRLLGTEERALAGPTTLPAAADASLVDQLRTQRDQARLGVPVRGRPVPSLEQAMLSPAADAASRDGATARDDLGRTIAIRAAAVGAGTVGAGLLACGLFGGQTDKVKHAAVSAAIAGTVGAITEKPWLGFAASVGVGVAKELIDGSRLNPRGQRDFRLAGDLGADLLGASLGALGVGIAIKF
jgi:hypothetical protein